MSKRKILNRMLGVATLAMMFGAGSVYAQSTPSTTGSSGTSGSSSSLGDAAATKQDATGQTPADKAGRMSPTGQSDTTSGKATSSGTSGTAGSSSSLGDAAATKQDASGQTPADKAGRMSPTGQSETTSGKPITSGASDTTGSSASGAAASGSVSKADQKMMKDLAQANMAEIEAAKLAQQKSSSDDVKTFAQKMIDDHTKAGDQLQQLAQSKSVTLPTEPDSKHQAELKKLGALSGDQFDKKYMAQGGVTDHRKTHALLKHIEKSAKDSDLKTLASNLAPTVDEHWQMAKSMKSGKSSTATGASGTSSKSKSSGPSSDSSSSTSPSSGSSDTSGASGSSGASSTSK